MSLPQEKTYTIEDIYSLPEGTRAELVDGRIYYMAPPTRTHQRILLWLSRIIADYIDRKDGNCEVNISPFAVRLDKCSSTYVEPDISVVCDKSKLDEKGCCGAPDWIIEIVSPGSIPMDYYTKLFKYRTAQVREYWIVDHAKDMITVYNFFNDKMERYSFSDTIKPGIYEDLSINFSQLNI